MRIIKTLLAFLLARPSFPKECGIFPILHNQPIHKNEQLRAKFQMRNTQKNKELTLSGWLKLEKPKNDMQQVFAILSNEIPIF